MSEAFKSPDSTRCPRCLGVVKIADSEDWHLYEAEETHLVFCTSCDRDYEVRSEATWVFQSPPEGETESDA